MSKIRRSGLRPALAPEVERFGLLILSIAKQCGVLVLRRPTAAGFRRGVRRGGLRPAQVLGDDSEIANVPVFMAPIFFTIVIDRPGFGGRSHTSRRSARSARSRLVSTRKESGSKLPHSIRFKPCRQTIWSAAACRRFRSVLVVKAELSRTYNKRLPVKRRYCVVENIVHAAINMALATRFPRCDGSAHFRTPLPPRPFDRADDPVARRRCKRNEFAARAFEREAVFVIPARRVRSQRCDAHAIFDFGSLCNPLLRRAVGLRGHPSLDVPAILGKIFWDAPQLHRFANLIAVRVPVRPLPANPRQPRPAPHHTKIGLAVTVHPTRARGPFLHASRRLMRFSCDANQGEG